MTPKKILKLVAKLKSVQTDLEETWTLINDETKPTSTWCPIYYDQGNTAIKKGTKHRYERTQTELESTKEIHLEILTAQLESAQTELERVWPLQKTNKEALKKIVPNLEMLNQRINDVEVIINKRIQQSTDSQIINLNQIES